MLKGKTAFISGTNKGIGKTILVKFAENGADVIAHARKKSEDFEKACQKISEEHNVWVRPVYFELTDTEAMKKAIKEVLIERKQIDIVVNNAGYMDKRKSTLMTGRADFEKAFEINYYAQIKLVQLLYRALSKSNAGTILNVVSTAGIDCDAGVPEYVASKAAMVGVTKRMAYEFSDMGIRVNAIAPGLTDTDMACFLNDEYTKQTIEKIALRRKAQPEEIANAVLFLVSDLSSYMNGQVLRVDGGMT